MARKADENGWTLDMVVLPESFAHVDGSSSLGNAEALDGKIVTALVEKAQMTARGYPLNMPEHKS